MTQSTNEHDEAAVWDVHTESEGTEQPKETKKYLCSFCLKDKQHLATGPFEIYICLECIDLARKAMGAMQPKEDEGTGTITDDLRIALGTVKVSTRAGMAERTQKILASRVYSALAMAIYEEAAGDEEDTEILCDDMDSAHAEILSHLQDRLGTLTFDELIMAATKLGFKVTFRLSKIPEGEQGSIKVAWNSGETKPASATPQFFEADDWCEDDEGESEDDDSPLSSEYYKELQRKTHERHVALGIDDLPDEASRCFCEVMAEAKITRDGIEGEEARQAVYTEMKQATLECIANIEAYTLDAERVKAIDEEIERRRMAGQHWVFVARQFRGIEGLGRLGDEYAKDADPEYTPSLLKFAKKIMIQAMRLIGVLEEQESTEPPLTPEQLAELDGLTVPSDRQGDSGGDEEVLPTTDDGSVTENTNEDTK